MPNFQPESLPGIESPPNLPVVDLTAMSEQIAVNALAKHFKNEDKISEVRVDLGYGPVEHHVPVEDEDHPRRKPENIAAAKAASERRRRRRGNRESRFSDVGSDLPYVAPNIGANQEDSPTTSPRIILGLGRAVARNTVEGIELNNIKNRADGNQALGLAMLRAHQEKPRT